MQRLVYLVVLVVFAGCVLLLALPKKPRVVCKRCNIVVISVDSLRADALPCYGYKLPTAPNLCRFAQTRGTLFSNSFANATWTRPSNMSIVTSLYPTSHGMVDPIQNTLNPAVTTLPQTLAKHGYTTRFVSNDQVHMSIELGYEHMFRHIRLTSPTFDNETLATWLATIDNIKSDNEMRKPAFVYFHTDHVHEYVTNLLHIPKEFPLDPGYKPPNLPSPKVFTDDTWKFMRTYLNDLAGVYRIESVITSLHLQAAELNKMQTKEEAYAFFNRLPLDMQEDIYRNVAEKTYNDTYFSLAVPLYRHLYDEQIRTFDLAIAQVLDHITDKGLADNTIVIITADHGQILGEKKLLGHIVSLAKNEIHVPLIMMIPGVPPQKINDLAQHIDIFPTIMELLGLAIPDETRGISLAGTIFGKKNAQKNAFVISHTTLPHLMYSIQTERWRLIESPYPNGTHRELYDYATDPNETKSVASGNQKIIEELTSLLHTTLDRQPTYPPVEMTFPEWKTESERGARVNQE